MTTAGSDRFRKAALALHGLSRRDQDWLLRRLLPSVRAPLQSLLGQLRTLGIAPGVRPDDGALPPVAENVALDAAQVALVDAAVVRRVTAVMALQPEQMQAILLNLHPWRWRAEFWDGLSTFQRSRMAELSVTAATLRPAMCDALLHSLAQALGSTDGDTDGDMHFDAMRTLAAVPGARL